MRKTRGSVKNRLIVGFSISLAISVIISIIAIFGILVIQKNIQQLYEQDILAVQSLSQVERSCQRTINYARDMIAGILTLDQSKKENAEQFKIANEYFEKAKLATKNPD